MSRKICIVAPTDPMYDRFWGELGDLVSLQYLLGQPEMVDLVCFTGGEDVTPSRYGHKNLGSFTSPDRDEREAVIFHLARKYEIPMTGICRGGQFLNVMCGGTLVQDLRGDHGGLFVTSDGKEMVPANSHHQMVVPGEGGVVLGWMEKRLRIDQCRYDGTIPEIVRDPENPELVRVTQAFAYPDLRIFGVQHHPEWQDESAPAVRWTLRMIRKFCWGEKEKEQCA